MRTNLKVFRVRRNLSQEKIADQIGCKRVTYAAIENGIRAGRQTFWLKLQQAFNVPESEMWELMKNE